MKKHILTAYCAAGLLTACCLAACSSGASDPDQSGAPEQIKRRKYCKSLEEYKGNILLVGINYDKKTKEHECVIERGNR